MRFTLLVAGSVAIRCLGVRRGGGALDNDEPNGFLLREGAFDVDDADGEEACFGDEGTMGAFIDVEGAVRGEAVEDPEGAVADGVRVREEARVRRWFGEAVEIKGGDGAGEVDDVCGCCWKGWRFGWLLICALDVSDDVRDVAGIE